MKPALIVGLFLLLVTGDLHAEELEFLGMKLRDDTINGSEVIAVTADGPAAQAGIRPRDVITAVDDSKVPSVTACYFAIYCAIDTKQEQEITLIIRRSGLHIMAKLRSPVTYDSGIVPPSPAPFPPAFRDYQILPHTISPDQRCAFIYPKRLVLYQLKHYGLYLARLKPFQILSRVPLGYSNLAGNARCSYAANWAKNSAAAVFIADSRWGPERVTLLTLHHGNVSRKRSLTALVRAQVVSDFRKSHAPPYNDYPGFVFDSEDRAQMADEDTLSERGWDLDDAGHVVFDCTCTTDPKEIDAHSWTVHFQGVWDIARERFISKSLTRIPPHPADF